MEHFVAKQRLYWRCCSSIIGAQSSVLSHRTFYLHSPTLARRKGCENAEVIDAAEVSPLKRTRPDAVAEDVKIPVLKFSKLSEHATAPTRGSAKAAGYDLFSAYDYSIGPMDKAIVKTDIQIAVPSGCYGRVAPRSGLAAKHFIDVGVKRGDRVAQLVCERICYPDLQELKTLDETERGSGGFGSTGSN
ncbi:deoxyuridine 5'-triphosphate nucleotidohydrolase, mitochondrial-like isoform X2 [Coregonus clupeaformis]|uniref:deoxyuridine 5'-triphosphate nucleotidohydrolase, mitochondrial-like isoform X2 n=1 Tax=Coregonus clupeaformis TaxID=59861 RepID=UPI001E1C99C7|nr:deoxyuridine 5'-triphosphate nucleotidohydrolase, mitochondrial-like isoform X2 [Coregonus clupeaformis]